MNIVRMLKRNNDNEQSEAKHIPIVRHINDNIIKSKDGDCFFTFAVSGIAYETMSDDDLDIKAEIRNTTLLSFEGKPLVFYSHTLRREINVKPLGSQPKGFLSVLDTVYNEKFKKSTYYINELYLTVMLRSSDGINRKFKKAETITSHEKIIINEVNDFILNIKGSFLDYDIRLLGIRVEKGNAYSEPMEFLSKIINLNDIKIKLPQGKLNNYLAVNRKVFGWNNLEIVFHNYSKLGALISIKNYCSETHAGMLDHLSSLNCEFVLTQTFKTQNRVEAIEAIHTKQRQMENGDYAVGLSDELSSASNRVASNEITMGESHFSLFLYSKTKKELDDNIGIAISELNQLGIITVIDKMNIESTFWAQLPSNTSYISRKGVVASFNFAHFSSFHNLPIGKQKNNKWGDNITVLTTANETPYYYNWHYKDIGLTTIIGPAGSGKTVVTLLMLAQSMKTEPSVFVFDKDRGAEIFVRACDGQYSNIKLGEKTNWNPLLLDLENKSNRDFVLRFLKVLLIDDVPLNAKDSELINGIVSQIAKTPKEERILRNFEPLIQATLPKRTYSFRRWITDKRGIVGQYAWCFDNAIDNLSIGSSMNGFDMTEFLDVPDIRAPILMYLFKRIENTLDGTPTIIVVDECQKATEDEYFRKEFENHAYTIRKRNGIVVMATQRAKMMNVMEGLVEQSQNQIFFANPKATENDYKTFALTKRELQIIKELPQKMGWFLLKRPDGSIIVRADLSGCDDELAVLSARSETLVLMDKLIAEHGKLSANWLPEFYEQWRNI